MSRGGKHKAKFNNTKNRIKGLESGSLQLTNSKIVIDSKSKGSESGTLLFNSQYKRVKGKSFVNDKNSCSSKKFHKLASKCLNKDKLNCFYTNARSIRNKFTELQSYVTDENPDIIIVSETWTKFANVQGNKFSQRDFIDEYKIMGYELFSYDRKFIEGGEYFFMSKKN